MDTHATTTSTPNDRASERVSQLRALQIDVGTYVLYQLRGGERIEVGRLLVERHPEFPNDTSRSIEHWCLYTEKYIQPSSINATGAIDFEYQPGLFGSAEDLRLHARNNGGRYIEAICRDQAP